MFIAHLPAGFLLSHRYLKSEREHQHYVLFLFIGLIASIAPDFDLLYFHLIDNRQHPHHSYWTHIPVYWVGIYFVLLYPIYHWYKRLGIKLLSLFLLCGLLHMTLDSFASSIKWLYPFNSDYYGLWRVPSVYDWWVKNYLFHWTFLIELLICAAAAIVFWFDRSLFARIKTQLLTWHGRFRLLPQPPRPMATAHKPLAAAEENSTD